MRYVLKINDMYLEDYAVDTSAINTSFVSYIMFTYCIENSLKLSTKEKAQQLADIILPLLDLRLNVVEYKEGKNDE